MARPKKRKVEQPEYTVGHYAFRPYDDDGQPPRQLRSKIVMLRSIKKLKSK